MIVCTKCLYIVRSVEIAIHLIIIKEKFIFRVLEAGEGILCRRPVDYYSLAAVEDALIKL
jgi:hypothetical protein